MRILYLSQYFPPEAGATQTRAYEMARNWVKLGHPVTMICEIPNHPSGIVQPGYRGKLLMRSDLEGIQVIHVWVAATPQKTFLTRMLFYLSYMVNAAIAGIFVARGPYDLLVATSPPLFVGAAALFLHYFRRLPLIFEVRDLWPESAVALGEIKGKLAISLATWLEERCYSAARRIVVVTEGIHKKLVERGLNANRLLLVPNGANVEFFKFQPNSRQEIRDQFGWTNHFVVMYAGIHGLAQGLETIVETAHLLKDISLVKFVLIGDGPKKIEIADLAARYKLPNLTLLGEQKREDMPAFLSAADAACIPLRRLEIFSGALPSKLFDAWACERPVLLSVDGEARALLESCQGGLFVPPENAPALKSAILKLIALADEDRISMGRRGRALTEKNFSRSALAARLLDSLSKEID